MQLFLSISPTLIVVIIIISIVMQIVTIIDIVKEINRNKNKENGHSMYLAWLLIVLFFSVIGSIFYFIMKNKKIQ